MATQQAFQPAGQVTIAATTASANSLLVGAGDAVLVLNETNKTAFVRFGTDNTVAATNTDFFVPAGQRALITVGTVVSYAAVILDTGATNGNVRFSRGTGTTY